jgi:hypothetical protein
MSGKGHGMTSNQRRAPRKHIPTWVERCDIHAGIVSNTTIQKRMQEEIDDLRFALQVALQRIECISQCVTEDYLKEIV